jgi:hypothetical protein
VVAIIFWNRIPILLVAFAATEGTPAKISTGRVRAEPPPAIVLIKPAKTPASNRMRIMMKDILTFRYFN